MKIRGLVAILFLLVSATASLVAEIPLKHIRVIVDTSASLHKTDPSGYVKLSTELFYDLARKELDPNDTFKVAHFPDQGDPGWQKTATPPESIDEKKYVDTPEHDEPGIAKFHEKMRGLPYTSQYTYFSPCIQWALKDLQNAGSSKDNRVIVLITDGIPEPFAEAEDSRRLQAMAVTLRENNIRVFVLAFGDATADWFNNAFGFGRGSGATGEAFAGADSGHLLTDMLDIFSRSFGFSRETVTPGQTSLDVARDFTLNRAAVVGLYRKPGRPDFRLVPPAGQSAGTARTFTEAAQHDLKYLSPWKEISYAYEWLEPPLKGSYKLAANGPPPDEIAILRPVRVQSSIRSYQGNATDVVMAGKEAPMEVLVSSTNGLSGDPGKVHVQFYQKYFKQEDEGRDAGRVYSVPGDGVSTPEGRVFVIRPMFIKSPTGVPPGTPYQGYIDVEVVQNDTPIDRMGTRMHPVTVYPYLSVGVSPNPAVALNSNGGEEIHGGQAGCVPAIKFVDNTQSLTAGRYMLAVRLADPLPGSGGWNGARFRFDGKDFDGRGPDWQATDTMTLRDLAEGKATLCVIAGMPTAEAKQDLQIHFGLWRDGADANEKKLNVVDDLILRVTIEPPGLREIWSPWLLLLLTGLLCALLWVLLRSKYELAPDLGVALAARGGATALAAAGAKGSLMSLLGFAHDRPIVSRNGDRELGRLKPLADDLFLFRPGNGFQNVSAGSGDSWNAVSPEMDGSFRLSSGVTYRAGMDENAEVFRIEYTQARPRL